MRIAVAKEVQAGERRVALVPDIVAHLIKQGLDVCVASGAGAEAAFPDGAYAEAGAAIRSDEARLWGEADVLVKVAAPEAAEADRLHPGAVLIGFLNPLGNVDLVQRLAERHVTAFSLEWIPRLSRAQSMDALSSQATVSGYKGALLAADALGKFLPMLTTAAGTIAPARVLVIGAGVVGLMAIATARRLGAVVEAFDIRPAVREEVQSLGATFVGVELTEETVAEGGYAPEVSASSQQREQDVLHQHIRRADIVITTAQVPGKQAPLLVTDAMVAATLTGSLVAFGKLQGVMPSRPITFPLQQPVNGLLILGFIAGAAVILKEPAAPVLFLSLAALALLLGVLFVLPIGSGDMPVVISFLNASSGLAASAAGFVLQNPLLIIAGALVGASGAILTQMMCKSMHRSLAHVLFSAFGSGDAVTGAAASSGEKVIHSVDVEEAAMMLAYAHTVIIRHYPK